MKLVAILAAHNRRELTLRCLEKLFTQTALPSDCEVSAVLVDDGSDDGTAEACRERLPFVRVVRGDGTLYWARAMALAEAAARTSRPDFLLWLNDDVELAPTALSTLLAATRQVGADAIIVGAVTDPESGEVVYSGLRRTSWRPKRFTLVAANDETEAADTFHGNVVLVPRSAYVALGAIDGGFAHAYADVDYGLRATRRGIRIYVSSPPIGTCRPNMDPGALSDTSRPLRDRLRTLAGPKGAPLRSQIRYLRRHGGIAWPLFVFSPFAKLIARHASARLRNSSSVVRHVRDWRVRTRRKSG